MNVVMIGAGYVGLVSGACFSEFGASVTCVDVDQGKLVAVLGLTFKPNTDDIRDAPSLAIVPALLDKGIIIRAHDPEGLDEVRQLLPDSVEYYENI